MGLDYSTIQINELATKSQDLFRQAGINTASTGKMSTKQAVNKIDAGYMSRFDTETGMDMVRFIFAYRSTDNTLMMYSRVHPSGEAYDTSRLETGSDRVMMGGVFTFEKDQLKKIKGAMIDFLVEQPKTKPQTESVKTTQTMQGQDPMQMLTQALAMMSQSGASVDEAQVEAIVERKLKAIKPTKVEVVTATATKRVETAHKSFADAVALVGMKKNIALIGEAGSGKSHGAIQMALALDLD